MEEKKETSQVAGTTKEVEKNSISINGKQFANEVLSRSEPSSRDRYFR